MLHFGKLLVLPIETGNITCTKVVVTLRSRRSCDIATPTAHCTGGAQGSLLIQEITMKPITNLRVVQSATVAMAGTCLSMIVYVVGQLVIG